MVKRRFAKARRLLNRLEARFRVMVKRRFAKARRLLNRLEARLLMPNKRRFAKTTTPPDRIQIVKRRQLAILIVSLLLIAAIVISGFRSRTVSNLRVRHEIAQVPGLASSSTSWEGKVLHVEGTVQTEADFIELSRRLANIVGAGYVVNNAKILTPEKVFEPNEHIGFVTITVNSRYDDSPESLKQISEIIDLPQFETLRVRKNSTLSSLILNRYHFGSSDLPRAYGLLVERIRDLNKLRDLDRLKLKILKVPILPPRAQQLNVVKVNTQPGFILYSPGLTAFALNQVVAERPTTLPKLRRKNEATSLLSFPITPSTLAETRRIVTTAPVEITSAKIRIRWADKPAAAADIHKTLSDDDRKLLLSVLNRQKNRHATVFVLDDGWPDKESYDKSIAELQHLSNEVRDHYGLGRISITHSGFVRLTTAHPHCESIRDSLKEFTDPDKAGVVTVVYLPLSKAQNSESVLQELLLLHFIIKATKSDKVLDDARLQYAQNETARALGNVLPAFDDQKIDTDEAILQAIWSVADFVAQKKSSGRDVFFVNESWTVAPGSISDAHPGNAAGIAVVAVGNTPGRVVNSDNGALDFASQCSSSKSVLAVLNVTKDKGLSCQSSEVNDTNLSGTFVAAYDGEVVPGASESCHDSNVDTCGCGTSFSTPRLAWMLALHEALRRETIDYTQWNGAVFDKVKGLRTDDKGIRWSGIYLRLDALMKE